MPGCRKWMCLYSLGRKCTRQTMEACRMRMGVVASGLAALLLSSTAGAKPLQSELPTLGVVWGGTAARARAAGEGVENTHVVQADAVRHFVSVDFDAVEMSRGQIVEVLNATGHAVGKPQPIY